MFNNVYQDYINYMIGSTPRNQLNFENNTFTNMNTFNKNTQNMELERFYPELYKLLYPMIQTACMRNTKPLTEENLNQMVRDIYSNFNADDVTILNINLANDVRSSGKNKELSATPNNKSLLKSSSETRKREEERDLRPNNYLLNDLIKILLIRELSGRHSNMFPINQRLSWQEIELRQMPFEPIDFRHNNIYEQFNV